MLQEATALFQIYILPLLWNALGAIVLWVAGGWVISLLVRLLGQALGIRKVDPTLSTYVVSGAAVGLRILLLIAILGVLGIETTSFAALLAAVGLAIGAAWSGLLAHFAAGIFLIVLRPYKVGDLITAAGITGTVRELGMLVTTIDTIDNVRIYVGNNKMFSESIINYSVTPYRHVLLSAQIPHSIAPQEAMARLRERIVTIPNVLAAPPPRIEIQEFNAFGTLLAVQPACVNDHYWQVHDDTNLAIAEVGASFGAIPEQRMAVRNL